jgi:predicted dehydrogenase
MIPNVGVALVGAGPWGLTLGRAAARLPNVDLRWVCDLKEECRQGAAALHPAARLTGALDEALEDPGVNAVLVAVESPQHHAVGRRVLEANRHVLIEKPMAITSADAAELTALAASRQRVLSVGHLLLHHPAVRRVRQLVEQGALGELLWLESTRLTTGPARSSSGAWWALAPHDVSLALHFFGTIPSRVSAVAHGARGEVDTVTWATLHFPDGGLAHIHVARRSPEKRRGFQLVGSRRVLRFDELAGAGELRLHDPGPGDRELELVSVEQEDPLSAQCRHFVDRVVRCDVSGGNAVHAVMVVRVLEAGARSMQAGGAPVEVA